MDEIVPDYKDNNLLKAFPKIFPYGIGGPEDNRLDSKGMLSSDWDLENYLDHVSKLSKSSIHESLFSLVIFNIYIKQKMVRQAFLQSRRDYNLISQFSNLKLDILKKHWKQKIMAQTLILR